MDALIDVAIKTKKTSHFSLSTDQSEGAVAFI